MSKFIDQLKRLTRAAPAPIGFLPRQPSSSKRKIQLMGIIAPENLDKAAEFIAGADAVLIPVARQNPSGKRLAALSGLIEIPWGAWLKGSPNGIPDLVKAECDFVIFPSGTPFSAAADKEPGRILEVEASLSDSLLRAVNELPADAVFVSGDLIKQDSLTWQDLMLVQRFTSLVAKPLLVPVSSGVGTAEIKALWEAGVDCLVVETEAAPPERLKELRAVIDGMEFPLPRRPKKVEAILPSLRREPGQAHIEEEEEEEE